MGETTAKRSIWERRAYRAATAANVVLSVALAILLAVLVNALAARFPVRRDFSRARAHSLSPKTCHVLRRLDQPIAVTALVETDFELFQEIRALLRASAAEGAMLRIRFVDPDRDLSAARALARRHGLTEANVLVLERDGRAAVIDARKMMDYDYWPLVEGRAKVRAAFRGEQLLTAAILGLDQSAPPLVGVTAGHGEGDLNQFGPSGYSRLGLTLRRDALRTVKLDPDAAIPEGCGAVVVLGPARPFPAIAVEALRRFLDRGGRALILLEPGRRSGLEGLLEAWGVRVGSGTIAAPDRVGRELLVTGFADHPATVRLRNLACTFFDPRPVEPRGSEPGADRAWRATVLAAGPENGWLENDPDQVPPRFDPESDRAGAIPLAVAVEEDIPAGLKPGRPAARLVVVGDADFVANGALTGGNEDLFMGALNWLLEREHLAAVSPKVPDEIRLDLDRRQRRLLFLIVGVGFSGAALLVALLVAAARRR